ncbi:MAG TPA: hypothetical protein VIX80_10775 [Candidatus Kapabacteria bacterium]
MKFIFSSLLLCTVLFIMSCNSDDNSTDTGNNNNGVGQDSMALTIDGTAYRWAASGAKNSSFYLIAGADASGKSVTLSFTNLTATGTHSTSGGLFSMTYGTGSSTTYSATFAAGTATANVTELGSKVKATFSGTLNRTSGSGGNATVSITAGAFNVTPN